MLAVLAVHSLETKGDFDAPPDHARRRHHGRLPSTRRSARAKVA